MSKITELVNKLFNTKANEEVIKGLQYDLKIPEKSIAKQFKNDKEKG